ncbi:MAG: glutamate synthase-related protein, partial [Succinivibrio sp.]
KLRHSLPGIGLISPPPHHDIYSIEDLAQLIFDLKLANTKADISVKLVSEVGIGTVAAGVAKCKADHIVISGHDGGTGAAPASSVKHAGSAWEIGLADVQQTLVMNKLRSRVTLQVDGQIKTGRDVIIGALLGADEFGFGTAPLVCMGCTIMRKCQKNTCPTGIATQDPELRKQFIGTPEQLENYFHYVAREVRELMAQLGIRKFDDLIGHPELLEKIDDSEFEKARNLSFEKIFFKDPAFEQETAHHAIAQQHEIDKALDKKYEAEITEAIDKNSPIVIKTNVVNVNRSVGTYTSGLIAARKAELSDNFVTFNLTGTAGQSFGAFLEKGITLNLSGLANDYVGKGMSGGIIAVHKNEAFDGDPQENIIGGNTCLYGATSGEAFFSGVCGERFAVRNSGADAVAEGCGDHGCEYMTGGTVVILGNTGRNFAAGMSGGMAYIYDQDGTFKSKLSKGAFHVSNVVKESKADPVIPLHKGKSDEAVLKELLTKHMNMTSSEVAKKILENFDVELGKFVKVFPVEYFNALNAMKEAQ